MAAQRRKIVGDEVPGESTPTVQDVAAEVSKDRMDVTLLGDSLEIVYSRSWELALVEFEKNGVFTSLKVQVPVDQDLERLGEWFSDKMNELQGTDLTWARELERNTKNPNNLITRMLDKED